MENIIEQMLFAVYFEEKLKELEQRAEDSLFDDDAATNPASVIGGYFSSGEYQADADKYLADLKTIQDETAKASNDQIKLWAGDSDNQLARGIQGITEDTANIIAAYLNTIRHHVILNTGYMEDMLSAMQQSQSYASDQLAELTAIRINTGRTADLLEEVAQGTRTLSIA